VSDEWTLCPEHHHVVELCDNGSICKGDRALIQVVPKARLALAESRLEDAVRQVAELEGRGAPHWTHYKARLEAAESRLARAVECLEDLTRHDKTWPTRDIVRGLIAATDHLLQDHDCDGHGWEEYQRVRNEAVDLLPRLDSSCALLEELRKP
jgi:hypothetical protein